MVVRRKPGWERVVEKCEEIRGIGEFASKGCVDAGHLYLGKFEVGTVLFLIMLGLVGLLAPVLYWYWRRRLTLEGNPSVSVASLLSDFSEPDKSNELWSKSLVAERGDKERAKYAYVEAVAAEREKQQSISVGKRSGFIVIQFILTTISFGIFRDLVGGGQFFVSGVGGLAILYFATSR